LNKKNKEQFRYLKYYLATQAQNAPFFRFLPVLFKSNREESTELNAEHAEMERKIIVSTRFPDPHRR